MHYCYRRWFDCLAPVLLGLALFGGLSLLDQRLVQGQEVIVAAAPTPAATINVFQAILLGLVQGATEFLPISSTAHLKVIPVLLGWGDPGVTFTAVIQLGSIGAVLWYFWSDMVSLSRGSWRALRERDWRSQEWRLAMGIALGTLPIVFFGFLLKVLVPNLDQSPMRSLGAIALASIVMAILLGTAERVSPHLRNFENLTARDGVWMGLAQSLALVPGVSRSGSTITAGLFLGLERETAARFSFLLGIPAITLAGLVELKDVLQTQVTPPELLSLGVGVISAAIFSYLSIVWLLGFLKKHNTWVFVWYRLGFGLLILLGIALRLIPNV